MATVTDRMTRYLLKRIRRRAVLDLYESAALVGLLTSKFLDGSDNSGMAWSITDQTLSLLTGDHEKDRAAVAKALRRARPSGPPEEADCTTSAIKLRTPLSRSWRRFVVLPPAGVVARRLAEMDCRIENVSEGLRRSGCWLCFASICLGLTRFRWRWHCWSRGRWDQASTVWSPFWRFCDGPRSTFS